MASKLTAKEKALVEEYNQKLEDEAESVKRRARVRALLFEYEKIPAYLINTALTSDSVSHAYLFHGPAGSLKKETAYLFAQHILCDGELKPEDELDYAQQDIVRRVNNDEYSSFIFLDGRRKEQISKNEIDDIQLRFNKTASEGNGKRVYIIDHFENASAGAMNGLLKFLEEPAEDVYAILTVDNIERILPTIRSRCVTVPFKALPAVVFEESARAVGLDEEDVYFISNIATSTESLGEFAASDAYQTAKEMLKQYLGEKGDSRLLYVDYETVYKTKAGENTKNYEARDSNLDLINYFLGMLIQYYKDVLDGGTHGPAWYQSCLNRARENLNVERTVVLLKTVTEQRDKINRSIDLSLLLAQTIYKLDNIE